jgi:hypothetical protein
MELLKKAETNKTISFEYDRPSADVRGYIYYSNNVLVSRTFDPNDLTVTFAKNATGKYAVLAVGFSDVARAEWPPPVVPPVEPPPASKWAGPRNFVIDGWKPNNTQNIGPGTYGDIEVSGSDKKINVSADAILNGVIRVRSGSRRILVEGHKTKSISAYDGTKWENDTEDIWIRGFNFSGNKNQALLLTGNHKRFWFTDNIIGPNVRNPAYADWDAHAHGMYVSSGGIGDGGVIGNVLVNGWRSGYGFQAYENMWNSVMTSCFFYVPADLGWKPDRTDPGYATVWSGGSKGNILANTIADHCRNQLAAGGAGASGRPAVTIIACAEVNCGHDGGSEDRALSGLPVGNDPTIAGEPKYRLPWDTRTSGIGTFSVEGII